MSEVDAPMKVEESVKKRRERHLYKGHVVHSGQIVTADSQYFRVIRVWLHHITLEPLSPTEVPEPALAIPITVQREVER